MATRTTIRRISRSSTESRTRTRTREPADVPAWESVRIQSSPAPSGPEAPAAPGGAKATSVADVKVPLRIKRERVLPVIGKVKDPLGEEVIVEVAEEDVPAVVAEESATKKKSYLVWAGAVAASAVGIWGLVNWLRG